MNHMWVRGQDPCLAHAQQIWSPVIDWHYPCEVSVLSQCLEPNNQQSTERRNACPKLAFKTLIGKIVGQFQRPQWEVAPLQLTLWVLRLTQMICPQERALSRNCPSNATLIYHSNSIVESPPVVYPPWGASSPPGDLRELWTWAWTDFNVFTLAE